NNFELTRAIVLPSLTLLTGGTIGFIALGFTHLWVVITLVSSSIPLISLLIYPPIKRYQLIKKYQEGEKHL
ncbi:MAG TPA: hypothetical protein V6C58_01710, partial [Allocoleopsis sp.]